MGAPFGNQNRAKSKRWEAALERAVSRYPAPADNPDRSDLMKGIDAAADAFVAQMMQNKDLGFFKEFGDRFDGKPAQGVTLSGDEDNPLRISSVVRKIVDPGNTGQP